MNAVNQVLWDNASVGFVMGIMMLAFLIGKELWENRQAKKNKH